MGIGSCSSSCTTIARRQDPKAVRDILLSLKMSTAPPDDCELYDRMIEYDDDEPDHADAEIPSSTDVLHQVFKEELNR